MYSRRSVDTVLPRRTSSFHRKTNLTEALYPTQLGQFNQPLQAPVTAAVPSYNYASTTTAGAQEWPGAGGGGTSRVRKPESSVSSWLKRRHRRAISALVNGVSLTNRRTSARSSFRGMPPGRPVGRTGCEGRCQGRSIYLPTSHCRGMLAPTAASESGSERARSLNGAPPASALSPAPPALRPLPAGPTPPACAPGRRHRAGRWAAAPGRAGRWAVAAGAGAVGGQLARQVDPGSPGPPADGGDRLRGQKSLGRGSTNDRRMVPRYRRGTSASAHRPGPVTWLLDKAHLSSGWGFGATLQQSWLVSSQPDLRPGNPCLYHLGSPPVCERNR